MLVQTPVAVRCAWSVTLSFGLEVQLNVDLGEAGTFLAA